MAFQDLPVEVVCSTSEYLDFNDILNMRRVCQTFDNIIMANFDHITVLPHNMETLCYRPNFPEVGERFTSRLLFERMKKDKASKTQATEIVSQITTLSRITDNANQHISIDRCQKTISIALTMYKGRRWVLENLKNTKDNNAAFYALKGDFLVVLAAWLGLTTMISEHMTNSKMFTENHDLLGSTLYAATYNDDQVLAKLLLDNEVNVYGKEGAFGDILQLAAYRGSERVMKLFCNTDKLRLWQSEGNGLFGCPPYAAAVSDNDDLTKYMLPASWKSKDLYRRTPLHIAAENGHDNVVSLLLQTGLFDPNTEDELGETPLSTAVVLGHETVIKLLLKHDNIEPQISNPHEGAPLQTAAVEGPIKIIQWLLSRPDFVINERGLFNPHCEDLPPILLAKGKHVSVVEQLLETKKVCFKKKKISGFTVDLKDKLLHWAVAAAQTRIVSLLLEKHGANPNTKEKHEDSLSFLTETPLHIAAKKKNVDLARILLGQTRTDPNSKDSDDGTPLMTALRFNNIEIVHLLLSDNRTRTHVSNGRGTTPLMLAVSNASLDSVHLINDTIICPDQKRDDGVTALHLAAKKGFAGAVNLLLSHNHLNPNAQDNEKRSPLHYAVCSEHISVVRSLLSHPHIYPNIFNKDRLTPLCCAVLRGNRMIVRTMIKCSRTDVNCRCGENGSTPLILAATKGNDEIITVLLTSSAIDVNVQDGLGHTALFCAANAGSLTIVQQLLEKAVTNIYLTAEDGSTALGIAAERGHQGIVRLLLEKGAKIDSRDISGKTALHNAAATNREDVVKLLLEKGAKADTPDKCGKTPIFGAASHGSESMVQLLLSHADININQTDHRLRAPLWYAASEGHAETVKLLLEKGAKADGRDWHGETPLYVAACRGHEEVAKILLENGVEAESLDSRGHTPLSTAASEGHDGVVRLLLGHPDVNPNRPDHDDYTPLYRAAYNGHESTVRLLLEHEKVERFDPEDLWAQEMLSNIKAQGYHIHKRICQLLLGKTEG